MRCQCSCLCWHTDSLVTAFTVLSATDNDLLTSAKATVTLSAFKSRRSCKLTRLAVRVLANRKTQFLGNAIVANRLW